MFFQVKVLNSKISQKYCAEQGSSNLLNRGPACGLDGRKSSAAAWFPPPTPGGGGGGVGVL